MTIAARLSGETFEAQLEEDEFHMLWLVHRNRTNGGRVQILLPAALTSGWRIAMASPAEQALLDSHGFGSEGCSEAAYVPYCSCPGFRTLHTRRHCSHRKYST